MDYEKEYKEALERAKAGKPLDEIFPQLKESEDERIREELLRWLKLKLSNPKVGFVCEEMKQWIAYLEKQKDEVQKQFNLGVQAGREEAMYEMEKEQKPAEWSGEDELMRTVIIQTLERFGGRGTTGMQIVWLKSLRPQPHWKPSKEQMNRLGSIIIDLRKDFCYDVADFLESLHNGLKKL